MEQGRGSVFPFVVTARESSPSTTLPSVTQNSRKPTVAGMASIGEKSRCSV
jgi:hypothetical protein